VGRDDGLDEKASREAEARVNQWREQGDLPFPHFPDQFRREVENSLEWPPEGSPGAAPRRSAHRSGADIIPE
jgi:MscS family membrane protein